MNSKWRGSHHTEEFKARRSAEYKEKYSLPTMREHLQSMSILGAQAKKKISENLSSEIIMNAKRDCQFLHKIDNKSKYKFISPEGLEFDSVGFAAKYYGCKSYLIDNWCKRGHHGWRRIPKTVSE